MITELYEVEVKRSKNLKIEEFVSKLRKASRTDSYFYVEEQPTPVGEMQVETGWDTPLRGDWDE
ncbi:32823_t:CDS:2 [Racocetra persica]|uniref:32823_t:CDS:1 n=1 Tax=Racocetra persica TaxID=160502 RepID=A0ACA9KTN3_9GLOM|nr:32823_t:CDS:2 [Racocetra persica]